MSKNNIARLEEAIWQMSEEELAALLVYIGLRDLHCSCMLETRIWRLAKEFCKQSGHFTTNGVTRAFELLLKAIKECDDGK